MPAFFDLCAGGFLSWAAQAGSSCGVANAAAIVRRGLGGRGWRVERRDSDGRKHSMSPVMSGLAASVALKSSRLAAAPQLPAACLSAWRARSHPLQWAQAGSSFPQGPPARRGHAELVQFSGGKPKPGSPSPDSLGLPCRLLLSPPAPPTSPRAPPTVRSAIDTDD